MQKRSIHSWTLTWNLKKSPTSKGKETIETIRLHGSKFQPLIFQGVRMLLAKLYVTTLDFPDNKEISLTKPPFGGDLGGLVVINCPGGWLTLKHQSLNSAEWSSNWPQQRQAILQPGPRGDTHQETNSSHQVAPSQKKAGFRLPFASIFRCVVCC